MESKQVDTTCPYCGKVFRHYRSMPRKYCSRKCAAAVTAKANLGIIENRIELQCEVCGVGFSRNPFEVNRTKHHFCSMKCFGAHLAKTQKGIPRPEVMGERPHLQKRVDKECPQCLEIFRVKQSRASRRRFCSRACLAEWQRINGGVSSGDKNGNWRGGYEPYYGPNWRKQRRLARQRDNFICRRCGVTEAELQKKLDVHHVKPFREFGIERYEEANDLSNLISYCHTCHKIVECAAL